MAVTITDRKSNKYKKIEWKKLIFYIGLIIFPVLQYLIFSIAVNFNSVIMSFQRFEYVKEIDDYVSVFVGFDNFKDAFTDFFTLHKYDQMLINSTIAYLSSIIITTPLALLFSFYIFKKFRGAKIFRTILFMPTIISTVILAYVFNLFGETLFPAIVHKLFYSNRMTFLEFEANSNLYKSYQLMGLGLPNTFPSLIFYHVFMGFGTNVLLYSGAMSSIDPSTIEAAKIDGCSDWKEFIHIILPGVYPTIVSFIVVGIGTFFTQKLAIYDIYGKAAQGTSIETIGYYLYSETVAADGGLGKYASYPYLSTLGVIFTCIVTPISFLVRHLLEKYGPSK